MRRLIALLGISFCTGLGADEIEDQIQQKVTQAFPGVKVEEVSKTPFADIYQVIAGPNILYVSQDGRYALHGEMLDLQKPQEERNITESARTHNRVKLLKNLKDSDMVIFPTTDHRQARITVFTDIDCGYCRKLHEEIPALTKAGIEVRYMSFARQGKGSESFKKAEAIWCSSDRTKALEKSMLNEAVTSAACSNPIEAQFQLALQLGVRGTPSILMDDGHLMPGYLPAKELIEEAIKHRRD